MPPILQCGSHYGSCASDQTPGASFKTEFGWQAVVVIITNPVNALTPLAAEVLKRHGVHDPRKVLGMTTLDVIRADTFVTEARGLDVRVVNVPVVGDHNAITILPLLSQDAPRCMHST